MTNKKFLFKTASEALSFYETEIEPNETKLIYFQTLKHYLNVLERNKTIVISEITKPENISLFLQCVNIYMAYFPGNTILFSDDYKSFKKQ